MSKTITGTDRAVPKLVRITSELHDIFKRGTADVIQIGRLLTSAKKEVGHGEFLPWLEKFSLSEKSAQRYMAAHKFMTTVAAPMLKSDKMSDLKVRPSALYELVELHANGQVAETDIEAVLKEAGKNWVGSKRLRQILDSLRPVETAATDDGEVAAAEPAGAPTADELRDTATSAEAAGDCTGEAHDSLADQPTPPDTAPKPKSAPSAKDHSNLKGFTENVLNLKRLAGGSATKYVTTAVAVADLEGVAEFVRAVADLKRKQSTPATIYAETSAEARKAHYAEADAA